MTAITNMAPKKACGYGERVMRFVLTAALSLAGFAAPALAQSSPAPAVAQRVDRLEREMRAVQRKVFPGGSQQYFEAEIAPPQATGPAPGTPVGSPVADLTARVDTLERELARLTGQAEQNAFKLRQIEESLNRFKGDTEFRLNALEGGAPPAPGAGPVGGTTPARPATTRPPVAVEPPVREPAAPPPPAASAAPVTPVTPSGDAGEDAYMAGYRLWEAKRYPEAVTALRAAVAKYPNHKRASYAQNLLGRAYLDDGKPAAAAEAFYANYQKMPRGERAPDSLYYLGQSLVQLKKPADACKVYDELLDVYGEKIGASLKERVAKGRADAKCKS
jgi:TolA-binding protein